MTCDSLSWDLLVRSVDNELTTAEAVHVASHLEKCSECRRREQDLRSLSERIEVVVNRVPVTAAPEKRRELARALDLPTTKPERVMRRFGWGMAIAAALGVGILLTPKPRTAVEEKPPTVSAKVSNAIEVDGETFVALPYSNPDIPSGSPRVVQMQVPLSSLAGIGIAMEPVVNQASGQDRSVLADVLLGADGQPLGVHVVSWE